MLTSRSNDSIVPQHPITIGIIGGGQLGKMIAQEAKRMSLRTIILDPEKECPAACIADEQITADFKNEPAIKELAKRTDVVTYEIELANSSVLDELQSDHHDVYPSPENLRTIQNKYRQKKFLKNNSIETGEFHIIESSNELTNVIKKFGFPSVLKACEDSYDGRGNHLIKSELEIDTAFESFHSRSLMLEKFVFFVKEVSVMVGRNKRGQIQSFPVVENIHEDGILATTIAPARISKQLQTKAKLVAEKVIHCLNGIGIFGVEMFVRKDGSILVNEISPRPHNSGHYSIEACSVSQFEEHIRAILGLPLSRPRLLSHAVMINLLGPQDYYGAYRIRGIQNLFSIPEVSLHVYGKKLSSPRRKLGHVTVLAENTNEALARAQKAKSIVEIVGENS
ncbi:MAG TPA: 5-(carboxyamino)imidazole ribonucleotide synthase [Nitrososphaeraceae archaeon]|jgi:5-(carboxyamino)imidazole ribonucleotide synthase|nr:5-(carboxyamino)imidazole ribonucleotide synthase [Nitrososphaeraceae archaeon]